MYGATPNLFHHSAVLNIEYVCSVHVGMCVHPCAGGCMHAGVHTYRGPRLKPSVFCDCSPSYLQIGSLTDHGAYHFG